MNTNSILIAALVATACTARTEQAPSSSSSGPGRSAPSGTESAPTQGKESPRSGEGALQTSFDYYDGDEKRTVWLSTDLVAEFAPSEAGKAALLRCDSGAQEVPHGQKDVRIWRVGAPQGTEAIARTTSTESARFSPVLHDGPSPGLPMRALPGGVVVTFPADWDRARIDGWLSARKLRIASEVVADANMFLVDTPPGIESIRIANELYETGELAGATPNFWVQTATR